MIRDTKIWTATIGSLLFVMTMVGCGQPAKNAPTADEEAAAQLSEPAPEAAAILEEDEVTAVQKEAAVAAETEIDPSNVDAELAALEAEIDGDL